MAARGRPRKPVKELVLEGKYREDRHGSLSDLPEPDGLPAMPDWLPDEAKQLWNSLASGLAKIGVATQIDESELAAMCDWWSKYRDASGMVEKMRSEPDSGKEYYRWSILAGMAWKNFTSAASKFGLNPADRAKMRLDFSGVKKEDELLSFADECESTMKPVVGFATPATKGRPRTVAGSTKRAAKE